MIEAADGAEALVQIQAGKPDIILLDIMMPVLDGLKSANRSVRFLMCQSSC